MKLSLEVLQDYIQLTQTDIAVLADMITERTAEVDEVEQQGALLKDCIVGQVQELEQHPDADRLRICKVFTGKELVPIVCGGSNLRNGMCIAFAPVGATVQSPDGEQFTLSKAKIRGQVSEGMICAGVELGLEDLFPELPEQGSRPIIDLGDGDEGVGKSLGEYLGLTDTIIYIDNHAITHRPDLFSHIGFARELVAMGVATWKQSPECTAPKFPNQSLPFSMNVANAEQMPRYLSCFVEIDSIGTTPDWMKRRLAATGWRCVNLPVDITNYVLIETGLPLHCFNADDIQGNITMRPAKAGEKITTLDETERTLSEGALILEDDAGIFDLLGIMGGLRSSTTNDSKRLYIHGASLDPVAIRKAMLAMGHRTDAGTVYEKGVQPYTVEQGFYRALQLLLELVPGAKITSSLESVGATSAIQTIALEPNYITDRLGVEVPTKKIQSILQDLGCTVNLTGTKLQITPPLWRRDLQIAEDIVEEVGRMYGYNSIEPVLPVASIKPPQRDHRLQSIRRHLAKDGFTELLPLSLVGPALLQKAGLHPADAVEILDPIGEELSRMQTSVVPRLLEQVGQITAAKPVQTSIFTVGHVFDASGTEYNQLGLVVAEPTVKTVTSEPFFQVRFALQQALKSVGHTIECKPATKAPAYGQIGRGCLVLLDGQEIGEVWHISPAIAKNFGIKMPVAVALLSVDALLAKEPTATTMQALPDFPAIEYDETVTMTTVQSAATVIAKLTNSEPLLESVYIKDVYAKQLPAAEYAVTFHFTYRSKEGTLTEAQLKPIHSAVLTHLTTLLS